ncbi:hypothetical protein V5799_012221 [Amblyomma americanum]|uniref:Uncharacterized protein n=1 Tax=Amblyomma americanum TaxID=6943 RepID=A0AAQ4EEL8_AMBAM
MLNQSPFKLRELDIRSTLNQPGAKVECDVCERQSTCDDTSLASLRLLRHLTRLTLYELDHTRTLDFLVGCGSLQELRLRNLGMWLPGCHQDMSPIADAWTQLRTLVLQSFFDPIDFTFLNSVPVAPKLTRLCVGMVAERYFAEDFASKFDVACPMECIIHLHIMLWPPHLQQDAIFTPGYIKETR